MVPYWVFDRPYSPGSVKIVLAAGKVTSTPCPGAHHVDRLISRRRSRLSSEREDAASRESP
jgi:hypothetical protein